MATHSPSSQPVFWSTVQATLVSSLPPQEVRDRLARALPRFDMATLQPLPRYGLSRGKSYVGALDEWTFSLHGPVGGYLRRGGYTSLVRGSIEPGQHGSIIRITGYNDVLVPAALTGISGILMALIVAVMPEVRGLAKLMGPLTILGFFSFLCGLVYLLGSSTRKSTIRQLVVCLESMFAATCQEWCFERARMAPVPQPKPWTPQQRKNITAAAVVCFGLLGIGFSGLGIKGLVTGELHGNSGKGAHRTPVDIYGKPARALSLSLLSFGVGLLLACGLAPHAVASHATGRARMSALELVASGLIALLFAGGIFGFVLSFALR